MISPKQNLLEGWKTHFYALSSEFSLNKKISRRYVDAVYEMIKVLWGSDFFHIDPELNNYPHQLHFLHAVLTKADDASLYYLLEISLLLDFAVNQKNADYINRLNSVKYKSDKAKEILFEIYIHFIFSNNKIEYIPNVIRGKQIIEGYATIENEKVLVECKKKYSTEAEELKLVRHLIHQTIAALKMRNYGFEGIGTITLKHKKIKQHETTALISSLKHFFRQGRQVQNGQTWENEHLRIELKPMTPENKIEIENELVPWDISFKIENQYQVLPSGLHLFNISFKMKVSGSLQDAVDKLIHSIKQARKQHTADRDKTRVFFFDNEFIHDFQAPLLNQNRVFEEAVKNFLLTKKTNDIIVLVHRNFITNVPEIRPIFISNEADSKLFKKISNLNFVTVDVTRINQS